MKAPETRTCSRCGWRLWSRLYFEPRQKSNLCRDCKEKIVPVPDNIGNRKIETPGVG